MMKRIVLSSLLIAGLAACSSTPVKETEAVKVEDKSATSATKSGPDSKSVTQSTVAVNPLKDPGSILSKRNVFFDFDEYVVKDEFKPLVQAHAKYLGQNGSKVTVLGNTDERGSREYNLALGQRRADAVKKAMTILGANDKQIETVSYGEEKAKCAQAEESCWAQNRRADLVYQGEQ
ncbi:MAG TPA: peptidoglycan-associated lipoprotein Pal [Burkholderiales bacterium]|nr:peptidoglycan-associated lipoprotein Pal [Burkholderiales bacterium]